jgi:hypothetical protein
MSTRLDYITSTGAVASVVMTDVEARGTRDALPEYAHRGIVLPITANGEQRWLNPKHWLAWTFVEVDDQPVVSGGPSLGGSRVF